MINKQPETETKEGESDAAVVEDKSPKSQKTPVVPAVNNNDYGSEDVVIEDYNEDQDEEFEGFSMPAPVKKETPTPAKAKTSTPVAATDQAEDLVEKQLKTLHENGLNGLVKPSSVKSDLPDSVLVYTSSFGERHPDTAAKLRDAESDLQTKDKLDEAKKLYGLAPPPKSNILNFASTVKQLVALPALVPNEKPSNIDWKTLPEQMERGEIKKIKNESKAKTNDTLDAKKSDAEIASNVRFLLLNPNFTSKNFSTEKNKIQKEMKSTKPSQNIKPLTSNPANAPRPQLSDKWRQEKQQHQQLQQKSQIQHSSAPKPLPKPSAPSTSSGLLSMKKPVVTPTAAASPAKSPAIANGDAKPKMQLQSKSASMPSLTHAPASSSNSNNAATGVVLTKEQIKSIQDAIACISKIIESGAASTANVVSNSNNSNNNAAQEAPKSKPESSSAAATKSAVKSFGYGKPAKPKQEQEEQEQDEEEEEEHHKKHSSSADAKGPVKKVRRSSSFAVDKSFKSIEQIKDYVIEKLDEFKSKLINERNCENKKKLENFRKSLGGFANLNRNKNADDPTIYNSWKYVLHFLLLADVKEIFDEEISLDNYKQNIVEEAYIHLDNLKDYISNVQPLQELVGVKSDEIGRLCSGVNLLYVNHLVRKILKSSEGKDESPREHKQRSKSKGDRKKHIHHHHQQQQEDDDEDNQDYDNQEDEDNQDYENPEEENEEDGNYEDDGGDANEEEEPEGEYEDGEQGEGEDEDGGDVDQNNADDGEGEGDGAYQQADDDDFGP